MILAIVFLRYGVDKGAHDVVLPKKVCYADVVVQIVTSEEGLDLIAIEIKIDSGAC